MLELEYLFGSGAALYVASLFPSGSLQRFALQQPVVFVFIF